jgi:chaperonin GroES
MRPLRDHILVRPDELNSTASASSIIITQRQGISASREQLGRTGTVVAVGPGKRSRRVVRAKSDGTNYRTDRAVEICPLDVQIGDRIVFGEWSYGEYEANEGQSPERLLVLQEADVIGVIEA